MKRTVYTTGITKNTINLAYYYYEDWTVYITCSTKQKQLPITKERLLSTATNIEKCT